MTFKIHTHIIGLSKRLGGKMENWSKTILSVYRYLEAISKAIDNLIVKKSINSAFYNNGRFNNAYDCANEIIDLTERKVNLINLKVLIENSLKKLEPLQRKVLTLTYIDNVSRENVCEVLEISTRSYFRKKAEGIKNFGKILYAMGYDSKKIHSTFESEKWLIALYNRNSCEECPKCKQIVVDDYKFINNIIKKYDFVTQTV